MQESQDTATPLSRDFVPELLRVVQNSDEGGQVTWNALESLEVLLDAGNTRGALQLAQGVVDMLGDDRRNRLFRAYIALCEVMIEGDVSVGLEALEGIFVEIQHGGFSSVDRCWISILLARAIWVGVYCRTTAEAELFRARSILSQEYNRLRTLADVSLACKVGLELAKTYVHCPSPEVAAAHELLKTIVSLVGASGMSSDLLFDAKRLLYQVERDASGASEGSVGEEELRSLATPLGGVARGLVEVSLARMSTTLSEARTQGVEKALGLFQESSYRSGEFESLLILANTAAESEHHAKAYRLFIKAVQVSKDGGFLYGRGLALLGAFQSAAMSGEAVEARRLAKELQDECKRELFLGAFGLNVVAALQLIGDAAASLKIATKCEKNFARIGVPALAGQASFMLGASYAEMGKWKMARSSWKRSLTCDEVRRSPMSACDRRAALAQAIAMVDFTEKGALQESTLREIDRLREVSERSLEPFGSSTAALAARAKTLHVHAQLDIIAKRSVEAVKSLSKAREIFVQLGLAKDVAVSDGLTGLALLEAAKERGSEMVDEAIAALQRSLDYFADLDAPRIVWKLHYYLTVAAIMRSQATGDGEARMRWREMAVSSLREAMREVGLLSLEGGMPRASTGEGDFSPGLNPDVLEPLKQVLGLSGEKKKKGKDKLTISAASAKRFGGYLH
jgi:tetratricopeptide (TPR) repeat protein